MLQVFKSDQRVICYHIHFKFRKKIKYFLNCLGLKGDITTIIIYVTIFALVVRKGFVIVWYYLGEVAMSIKKLT